MPPERTPLGPIDGNPLLKKALTEFERGRIIGMHDSGAIKAAI